MNRTLRTIPFRGSAERLTIPSNNERIESQVIRVLLDPETTAVGLVSTIDGPRLIVLAPPEYLSSRRDALGQTTPPEQRLFALVIEGGIVGPAWKFIGSCVGSVVRSVDDEGDLVTAHSTFPSLESSELFHVFEVSYPRLSARYVPA